MKRKNMENKFVILIKYYILKIIENIVSQHNVGSMPFALPKNLIESKFDSTNVSAETKLFCKLTDELQVI